MPGQAMAWQVWLWHRAAVSTGVSGVEYLNWKLPSEVGSILKYPISIL
jgi:hypothetical protein